MIKSIDGCKRIAATIFLYFLNKNNLLFKGEEKIISDSTLVAITLLLAESKPEEEIMVNVIMNFLEW
jgi:phosphoribosylaminoimidazolesuccinocarboxamide synthase|nr:phosphoribosylaminoimidazolesuccinocarboxamide synthase [uncultured Lachnoanaerobaculum sp.]